MFSIYTDGQILHNLALGKERCVLSPKLTLEIGKSGSLEFTLPPGHELYNSLRKLKSMVTVFQNDEELFRGRILHDDTDFYRNRKIYCEGDLSFLLDSQQRPYSFQGDIPELFSRLVHEHNSRVDPAKRFEVGYVTVTDPNNYINRSSEGYSTTLSEINDKLLNTHGGYIRTRVMDGIRYLDYIRGYERKNTQTIEFGHNMLDISEYITAEDVFTVLIPLGAEQLDEEGNSVGSLKICDVNNGLDYIEDAAAINLFGRIERVQHWEDVTVASNLLSKARKYLEAGIEMAVTLSVRAVDLHFLNADTERIRVGDMVRVISRAHTLDAEFQCTKIAYDLVEPDKTEFTFGLALKTITERQTENQERSNQLQQEIKAVNNVVSGTQKKIDRAVTNATKLITGASGGYVILDRNAEGKPYRILVMDAETKNSATNIIQINKNGIGFSTSGINGPYRNAWTIDGKLVAEFIKTANLVAGTVGGWSVAEDLIRKDIAIDGYFYQIAMQAPNGTSTTNCYYVRRKPDTATIADEADWEYVFRIRYNGYIYVTSGMIGGWTVTGTTIRQQEVLNVNGDDYIYQVCLQCVSDEKETSNFIYVRRYLASQPVPADSTGWEYLARINKHGDGLFQQLRARKSMQAGQITVSCVAGTVKTVRITFVEEMCRTPVVVVSPISGAPNKVRCSASNRSTTGFTLNTHRDDTVDTTFAWIAFAD